MAQKLRVPLGFLLAAAVLYLATPTTASILAGLPVAVAGSVFRALAAGVVRKDSALATSGVYALTRNPLYFGSALLACGFAIMSASETAALVMLIPFGLIYPTVILREEAHLARLFPDEFRLYRKKAPRFFPRLTLRFSACFSVEQYLANREYNAGLGLLAGIGVFWFKSHWGV